MRRVAPAGKTPFRRSRVAAGASPRASSVTSSRMWRSSMAEEKRRMGAPEGVACADDAVVGAGFEIPRSHGRGHGLPVSADRSGRPAGADGLDRYGELDEAAAPERVPEAALPADDRGAREGERRRGDLHPPGVQRSRAVPLE